MVFRYDAKKRKRFHLSAGNEKTVQNSRKEAKAIEMPVTHPCAIFSACRTAPKFGRKY